MKFFFPILLLFACSRVTSQNSYPCRYPIDVSADSLFRFVAEENRGRDFHFKPEFIEQLRNCCFDKNDTLILDSAYNICQKHLISKLGQTVYCHAVSLTTNSFLKQGDIPGLRILRFYYQPLSLLTEYQIQSTRLSLWRMEVCFNYYIYFTDRNHFNIIYPDYIPDCRETDDCGYKISLNNAIDLAQRKRFINNSDKYIIRTDGVRWIFYVANSQYQPTGKRMIINLRTGKYHLLYSNQRGKYKWNPLEDAWHQNPFNEKVIDDLRNANAEKKKNKPCLNKFPTNVSVDSLFKFVVEKEIKAHYLIDTPEVNSYLKEYVFDRNDSINLDSAFNICQKHLIDELGQEIFCRNIEFSSSSFSRKEKKPGQYLFSFIFNPFNLLNKESKVHLNYMYFQETIAFKYFVRFKDKTHFKIKYPVNLPDCNGKPDCGYKVTIEKAIAISKKSRFSDDNHKYVLQTNGINMFVSVADSKFHPSDEKMTISLKTGKYKLPLLNSAYGEKSKKKNIKPDKRGDMQSKINKDEKKWLSTLILENKNLDNCKIPFDVSSDSLFRYASEKYIKDTNQPLSPELNKQWGKYKFNKSDIYNLDSAYHICQIHLLGKLGKSVFCNYISLSVDGFSKIDNSPLGYSLVFVFNPSPILDKNDGNDPHYFSKYISFSYHIRFFDSTHFEIDFPKVPDCLGKIDCGYVISLQKATELAKKIKFINDTVMYQITSDGFNWIFYKNYNNTRSETKCLIIDLRSGKYYFPSTKVRVTRKQKIERREQISNMKRYEEKMVKNRIIAESRADKYISDQIMDKKILERISRDSIQPQYDHTMVLYRVRNELNRTDSNLLIIHLNETFTIDTEMTRFNSNNISMHIKDPSRFPLNLSSDGAEKIATEKGMIKGINPWIVQIDKYDDKDYDYSIKWSIRSTFGGGSRSSGQWMMIRIDGINCSQCGIVGSWDSIE